MVKTLVLTRDVADKLNIKSKLKVQSYIIITLVPLFHVFPNVTGIKNSLSKQFQKHVKENCNEPD